MVVYQRAAIPISVLQLRVTHCWYQGHQNACSLNLASMLVTSMCPRNEALLTWKCFWKCHKHTHREHGQEGRGDIRQLLWHMVDLEFS
jgi:hypothetical protein